MSMGGTVRGRDQFNKLKKVFYIFSKAVGIFPASVRKSIFENARNIKGRVGIGIRYILLRSLAKQCGDNVSIREGCYVFGVENLEVGSNISIWPQCYIDATGGIEIGDDVSIAHGVTILSTTHLSDDLNIPIKDQGIKRLRTVISNDVWIGAKATVRAGITVGKGVIVGAGAVVTRNVNAYDVVGGVPAQVIKKRRLS